MYSILFILLVGLSHGTVEPLTDAQKTQLQTASDFTSAWDEAALYPLLQNTLQWKGANEAGALIPDYDAMLIDPARYRGKLCVVTGQLGGPVQVLKRRLARPGMWDGKIQRWSILTHVNPDQVAVIYLVDPPPLNKAPKASDYVRILCRFYKVWRFKDLQGKPTEYLVFIGKTAKHTSSQTGGPLGRVSGNPMRTIGLMLVLVFGACFFILKRFSRISLKTRMLPSQLHRRQQREDAGALAMQETSSLASNVASDLPEKDSVKLPKDPAEALRILSESDE